MNEKELARQYVEEAPYHPGYEDAVTIQDIKIHKPPTFVGSWTIGGSWVIFVKDRPTDDQIKHTTDYFGWVWTDGDMEEQARMRNES